MKRVLLLLFLISISGGVLGAQTYTAIASGDWADPRIWDDGNVPSLGGLPGGTDNVIIEGYDVTISDTSGVISVKKVSITNTSSSRGLLEIIGNNNVTFDSLSVEAKNYSSNVRVLVSDATLNVDSDVLFERAADNATSFRMQLVLNDTANILLGGNFHFNYQNASNLEVFRDLIIKEGSSFSIGGNAELTINDGKDLTVSLNQGNMTVSGDLTLNGNAGGKIEMLMQDTSKLTVGGNVQIINAGCDEDVEIKTDAGPNNTIVVNGSVTIDSRATNKDAELRIEQSSKLDVNGDITFKAVDDKTAIMRVSEGSSFYMAGNFNLPDNYGDLMVDSSSSIYFDGSIPQTIPASEVDNNGRDTFCLSNVVFNNTSDSPLVLQGDMMISDFMDLDEGVIQTSSSAMLILEDGATISAGSKEAFIDGPILKKGSTNGAAFVFPLGDNGVYAPLEIPAVTNSSYEYQAQYFADPPPLEDGISPPIGNISTLGYWSISKGAGTGDTNFSLHWSDASAFGISNPDSLIVAGLTDNGDETNTWESYGNGGTTGGTGSGVSGTVQNALGDPPPMDEVTLLTFGSTSTSANALPVTLVSFGATLQNKDVNLSWTTSFEENIDYFIVERSTSSDFFEEAVNISTHGNSNANQQYNCIDYNAKDGVNLYRLKIVELDGTYTYSKVISVTINGDGINLRAFPNPTGNKLTVSGFRPATKEMEIQVEDQLGRTVFKGMMTVEAGQMRTTIMDLNIVDGGIYFLRIGSGVDQRTIRLIRIP